MIEHYIIAFLLVFIMVRDIILTKELQKLVDKVISRNYTEYTSCQVDIETAKKKESNSDVNRMVRV